MAKYTVVISKTAQKQLDNLPDLVAEMLWTEMQALGDNPRSSGCKKLKGYANAYRIRKGDYRVIYEVRDKVLVVEVIAVGHRKNIYN
jgi:mRNA interferase RelE/StbE